MNKTYKCAVLILMAVVFGMAIIIAGCSSGSGIPSPDIPPMPTGWNTTDVSGTWHGTFGSYQPGGLTGTIDPLQLTQTASEEDIANISGTIVVSGYPDFEGQTGQVTGTLSGSSINMTAKYGTKSMVFSGNANSVSMTGSYKIYDGDTEKDSGNFTMSKQ